MTVNIIQDNEGDWCLWLNGILVEVFDSREGAEECRDNYLSTCSVVPAASAVPPIVFTIETLPPLQAVHIEGVIP